MKILKLLILFFLLCSYLLCHVERDEGGLFTKIIRGTGIGQDKMPVRYEARTPKPQLDDSQTNSSSAGNPDNFQVDNSRVDNSKVDNSKVVNLQADSLVFNIQGMAQFTKLVVKNSYSKPVVLKIYSSTSNDSEKVTPVFQSVADEFKNQVIFAGLNVTQNMEIFMQISMFYKLRKIDLPLFLFYKDGQLLMPFLAGFQPQEYLSEYIQKRFFGTDGTLVELTQSE